MSATLILVSVALYTLVVFAVGMWGFKKARPSMEDFFLGGRTLGLFFVLAATWSTLFSAYSYIGLPGAYYRSGISFFGVAGNILFNSLCMYVMAAHVGVGHKFRFINPPTSSPSATRATGLRHRHAHQRGLAPPYLGLQIRARGSPCRAPPTGHHLETGLIYITVVVLVYVLLGGFRSVTTTT